MFEDKLENLNFHYHSLKKSTHENGGNVLQEFSYVLHED